METTNLTISQAITANLGIPQIVNIIDALPVNPSYSWAELESLRSLTAITTIVLHHDAISKASSAKYGDVELAQRIAKSHIRSKGNVPGGDPGFPYDIWIRNGIAYQCNDLLPFKYAVRSNNAYTVHVCVSGNYFAADTLTDPDRRALVGVVLMLKQFLPSFQMIKGHGEIVPTNCPGYDVRRIRSDVGTLEMQLQYKETDTAQAASAFAVASRILSLYETAKGGGEYSSEAKRKLLLLEPECKRLGLLS